MTPPTTDGRGLAEVRLGMPEFLPLEWSTTLLDALPCLIVVWNSSGGGRTWANQALVEFCQSGTDDPLGVLAAEGRLYRPDRTLFSVDDLPARVAAASNRSQSDVEIVVRRPDASERLTVWSAACLPSAAGPLGVAVGRDATDERELAQARQDWLAAAAHDLRSPTTTVLLALQLAKRQITSAQGQPSPALLDECQHQLELAEAKTKTLIRRMDALLSEAVGGADQHRAHAAVDLVTLARQTIDEFEKLTTRHQLTVDGETGQVVVDGDDARLRAVLGNLVENAVKYSPDGGPVLVKVRRAHASDLLSAGLSASETRLADAPTGLVQVVDHGVGIRPDDVPHVFERFRRGGGSASAIGGTGLGLYMARVIVESHGGRIWIADTAGREKPAVGGTTVCFTVPLAPRSARIVEDVGHSQPMGECQKGKTP